MHLCPNFMNPGHTFYAQAMALATAHFWIIAFIAKQVVPRPAGHQHSSVAAGAFLRYEQTLQKVE